MENKYLIGSFVLGTVVQTIVVIIPALAEIFKLVPLNQTQWIITIIISLLPIPIMELQKDKSHEIRKIIYMKNQGSIIKNKEIFNIILILNISLTFYKLYNFIIWNI